jgi:hypothetical protein
VDAYADVAVLPDLGLGRVDADAHPYVGPPGHAQPGSLRWTSTAAATAPLARANAAKKASPCVSTSCPCAASKASRRQRSCSFRTVSYPSPRDLSSRVDPSMSVKRKVTGPERKLGHTRLEGSTRGTASTDRYKISMASPNE